MLEKRYKRCDCNGGLGGDGWATEFWRGDFVCKECKRKDLNVLHILGDKGGRYHKKFKENLNYGSAEYK